MSRTIYDSLLCRVYEHSNVEQEQSWLAGYYRKHLLVEEVNVCPSLVTPGEALHVPALLLGFSPIVRPLFDRQMALSQPVVPCTQASQLSGEHTRCFRSNVAAW